MDLQTAFFETDRLRVRTCRADDAPRLAQLMTPGISRWVAAWPTPTTPDDATAIIDANLAAAADGAAFPGVVEEKGTGRVIGWLKVDLSPGPPTTAELGYWIGEAFQQRGFAHEAASGAIGWAFSDLSVQIVTAGAQTTNEASITIFQRLGLEPDGQRDVWAPARQRFEPCTFWSMRSIEPA